MAFVHKRVNCPRDSKITAIVTIEVVELIGAEKAETIQRITCPVARTLDGKEDECFIECQKRLLQDGKL